MVEFTNLFEKYAQSSSWSEFLYVEVKIKKTLELPPPRDTLPERNSPFCRGKKHVQLRWRGQFRGSFDIFAPGKSLREMEICFFCLIIPLRKSSICANLPWDVPPIFPNGILRVLHLGDQWHYCDYGSNAGLEGGNAIENLDEKMRSKGC